MRSLWLAVAAAIGVTIVVIVVLTDQRFAGLLLLPLVAIVFSPFGRLAIFGGGALLVFQTSEGVGVAKFVYLGLVALAMVIAITRLSRPDDRDTASALRWPLLASAVMTLLITASAVGSLSAGVEPFAVFRDATTYFLIVAAIPIGAEAGAALRPESIALGSALIAIVAAASFAVVFLSARSAIEVPVERFGIASMMIIAFGFSLGLVKGLSGRRARIPWLAVSAALAVGVLVTGTRTGLALVAALVALVGRQRMTGIPVRRLVVGSLLLVGGLGIALWAAASSLTRDGFFQARLAATLNVLENGVAQDQSGLIRLRAVEYANDAWSTNLLFGVGFGHAFPNPNPGRADAEFQLDTPMILLAKFGIFGVILLCVFACLLFMTAYRRLPHSMTPGVSYGQMVLRGFLAVCVVTTVFGAPTEDKGFSVAVLFAVALISSCHVHRRPSAGLGSPQRVFAEPRS